MDRLEQLLQFYQEDPTDAFTRFALAQEYWKRGDTAQALRFFEELVRDHPDYVGTYYHLAKLYRTLGRLEEARRTYQQGIEVARRVGDAKSLAELQDALMALELGEE
ncbi:Tetratricopeptide repeat-containing protein [Rhodothermus profundi]|uniref:Tetratricopeptide repeat-containing protein n=2 Tax=Rhodothermus profundi TaxID=633813 RepID=A0A1M6WQ50_9BACT|nr:Tetratricopeptide repeat-containing protein [Rhodothermus profundi]